jgi:hypothetical protein
LVGDGPGGPIDPPEVEAELRLPPTADRSPDGGFGIAPLLGVTT